MSGNLRARLLGSLAVLCVAMAPGLRAHPGRLDKYGGHHERREGKVFYHFHKGPLEGKEYPSRTAALRALKAYFEEKARRESPTPTEPGPDRRATIEMEPVRVLEVDVFKLGNGRLVRLIGLVRPRDKDRRLLAAGRVRQLIQDKKIQFEFCRPPEGRDGYYQGFAWVEQTGPDGKARLEMVNLIVAREGLCRVDLEATAPHTKLFKDTLGIEQSRPRFEVEKVFHTGTLLRIKTGKLVRVAGLDAPRDRDLGEKAKGFVEGLVVGEGKYVEYERCPEDKDPRGAIAAFIWIDEDTMLNELLIEKGYARPDPRLFHKYDKRFREALKRYEESVEKPEDPGTAPPAPDAEPDKD
jgi:hypothetical protein